MILTISMKLHILIFRNFQKQQAKNISVRFYRPYTLPTACIPVIEPEAGGSKTLRKVRNFQPLVSFFLLKWEAERKNTCIFLSANVK